MSPTVGVLALQGDFAAHAAILARLGASTREVRVPGDLPGLDALVIPGGESTTMTLGIEREGLAEPLRELAARRPVLGTCAGLIMLDQLHLGVLDVVAERNAFGRQVRSFEADLDFAGIDDNGDRRSGTNPGGRTSKLHAVFIRAPWVTSYGPTVEVLAEVEEHPVAVRDGHILAVAFHPELTGETRVHQLLLDRIGH